MSDIDPTDPIHADPPTFLVVGCQRSGTTWVQQLLDAHPNLACAPETALAPIMVPLLKQFADAYAEQQRYRHAQFAAANAADAQDTTNANAGAPIQPRALDESQLNTVLAAAFRAVLHRHAQAAGKPPHRLRALGEKTPEHTLYLPLLDKALPGLRVVHIVRDPRDVAVSGYCHNRRLLGQPFLDRFPDFDNYVRYAIEKHWLPYLQAARGFAHQAPDRYVQVRYEDLHRDPTPPLRAMLGLLEADADDATLDACLQRADFRALTHGRPRGSEDPASFFRKGSVGDHRDYFTDQTHHLVAQLAAEPLQQLGYAA